MIGSGGYPALLSRCAAAGVPVAAAPPAGTVHQGVLWLRADGEDDLAEVVEATPEARQAGARPRRLLLPRVHRHERPHRGPDGIPLPPWAMRLSRLARQVRGALGDANWRLSVADDGAAWVLGLVPAGRPPRQEALVVLGGTALPPGPLTATVLAGAGQRVLGEWRRVLPVPAGRDLVHVRGCRPYLNVSLVEEAMRRAGLPTRPLAGPAWLPEPLAASGVARLGRRWLRLARAVPALARADLLPLRLDRRVGEVRAVAGDSPPPAGGLVAALADGERLALAALRGYAALGVADALGTPGADRRAFDQALLQAVAALRGRVGQLAAGIVQAGRLPDPGAVWLLRPEELPRLASGWRPPPALLAERAARLTPSPPAWFPGEVRVTAPGSAR